MPKPPLLRAKVLELVHATPGATFFDLHDATHASETHLRRLLSRLVSEKVLALMRGKREEGGETKGRIPHGYRLTPAGLRAFTALS